VPGPVSAGSIDNKLCDRRFHVDDSSDYFGSAPGWSFAILAVQPFVGLLPQRRTRLGCGCSTCAASGRATLDLQVALGKVVLILIMGSF
jgi:hypothetical protein